MFTDITSVKQEFARDNPLSPLHKKATPMLILFFQKLFIQSCVSQDPDQLES